VLFPLIVFCLLHIHCSFLLYVLGYPDIWSWTLFQILLSQCG